MDKIEILTKDIVRALSPEKKEPLEFCQHSLGFIFNRHNESERDFFLLHLFIMNWIDQNLYWTLVDLSNPECLQEEELYYSIRNRFNIIKIYSDWNGGPVRPSLLFNLAKGADLFTKRSFLLRVKEFWWDNHIRKYLESINRSDIIKLVEKELLMDLKLRHRFNEEEEIALRYLLAN